MAADQLPFIASWRVGRDHVVTMTVQPSSPGEVRNAEVVWRPYMPSVLTDEQKADYQSGLYRAMCELMPWSST